MSNNYQRIVIIGGGFGGFYLTKYLEKNKKIKVILINPLNYFVYTPLIHEVSVGNIPEDIVKIPFKKIFKKTVNIESSVHKVDFNTKEILLQNTKKIHFDILVIATGGNVARIIKGSENYPTLKELKDAIDIKEIVKEIIRRGKATISIIGEGPTGTELIGELSHFFKKFSINIKCHHFLYFTKYFQNIKKFDSIIKNKMKKLGVVIHSGEPVVSISNNQIKTNKRTYNSDVIFICTGIAPRLIASNIEFKEGFHVDSFCLVENQNNVFSLGDCALFPFKNAFAPRLAQTALKEAKYLAKHIIRKTKHHENKPLRLKINGVFISIGKFFAIANFFDNYTISGPIIWLLKRTYYFFNIFKLTKEIRILKYYILSNFLHYKYL